MRDALIARILTLAETLVQTRYRHYCSDGMNCVAVDGDTVKELDRALTELRESDDAS
jgi:hypothetical protein